jgi:hypothetical protein
MKVWTYGEMDDKVRVDLDLQDEDFVTPDEMVGYANEAIDEAEATIHTLGAEEEYFLKRGFLALVTDQAQYSLPSDIYAMKIRGIIYQNGPDIYPINRIRRSKKFELLANLQESPTDTQAYRYFLHNPSAGLGVQMELVPAARETTGGTFTVTIAAPGVFTKANHGWANGQAVRLQTSGALPTGLQEEKTYYVVNAATNTFELSLTAGGGSITTSGGQSGTHQVGIWPARAEIWYIRNANRVPLVSAGSQGASDATVIDIPEFANFVMQAMRVRCLQKEGDPRLQDELAILQQQRKMMVDTLTDVVPDDDNTVQADFSAYEEHT